MRFWPFAIPAILVALSFVAALHNPAKAQQAQEPGPPPASRCADLDKVLAILHTKAAQNVVSMGSVNGTTAVVIVATPDGATWTLLSVTDKVACVLGMGREWIDPVMKKALAK